MTDDRLEKVRKINSMQEEPKKCMFPKDHYTDEDRKVLCKDCEEECEYSKKEPASKVWHDMIEEAENGRNIIIIDPKDFYGAVLRKGGTQLKNHNKERYVKWAYIDDIINVTNKEEPVSEDLEQAIDTYLSTYFDGEKEKQEWPFLKKMAIYFAEWQKQKTIRKACDWITEINNHHYIMRYSDSCEVTSKELIEWFKNYMEE